MFVLRGGEGVRRYLLPSVTFGGGRVGRSIVYSGSDSSFVYRVAKICSSRVWCVGFGEIFGLVCGVLHTKSIDFQMFSHQGLVCGRIVFVTALPGRTILKNN